MRPIWPDVAVTDDSLVQCLVEIRRALGDDQAWIHTARGRGYRFDGDVRPLVDSEASPADAPSAAPRTSPDPDVAAPIARLGHGYLAVAVVLDAGRRRGRRGLFWGRAPA